ncbi:MULTISPECIES: copper resistance CopC family protein [unclassified Microbacterium]|uniref:copper resistance CopC family protein n=1 Tax=unclassified Microbacterium TaxID=2609290 RepID=UPI00301AB004
MPSSIPAPPRRPRSPVEMLARAGAIVAATLAVLVGTFMTAAPASAHDELIGAEPAAQSQVDAPPDELVLTFSGVLLDQPGTTEVVVTDAAGTDLTDGDPVLSGTRLTQPLTPTAQPGAVTVVWRVVSSDGHPVSGQYTFTVGGDADGAPTPAASPTEVPGAPMEGTDMTWLLVVGGIVLVGAGGALVAVLLARSRPPHED